MINLNKIEKSF